MKNIYIILLLGFLCLPVHAQVDDYFNGYKINGNFSFELEQQLLQKNHFLDIIPFSSDTIVAIRQQSYYLTYKFGLQRELEINESSINHLISGIDDTNQTIVGNCILYLQSFSPSEFSIPALQRIDSLLQSDNQYHFRELYKLAAYLGVGLETIQRQLLQKDKYNNNQRWVMHLALARLGHAKSIQYCLQVAEQIAEGNDQVAYLVPDLIYTRQRELINYCLEILNSNEENCSSPNPDIDTKILCAYRVLELLAPIIRNFPYKHSPSGYLQVEDYQKALYGAREWFFNNPDYQINSDTF
ncbi:hypothetical protein [Saccharicrinis aurantiacus]|uniref:hypothetical protein n=1 Tax=Saccharicrinis aurantiacus TaxID=1849719 RepID=UPI00083875B8|nr:hypothetical protein [Saccharicrinis aurantiacus]